MQHEVYPGFAKMQTSDSLTPGDNETVDNEMPDDDPLTSHKLDVEYLRQIKPTSNNTARNSTDQKITPCDCIFTDGSDNLELCIPHSKKCNGFHNANNFFHYSDNVSTKRHRKGDQPESDQNQVKWWRNNITATMERFEPTQNNRPSTSTSCLDYGLIASVVSSGAETTNSSTFARPPIVSSSETRSKYNIYSYAYHEPAAVKCHANFSPVHRPTVSTKTMSSNAGEASRSAQWNSFRTLLSKKTRSGLIREQPVSPCVEDRHTYTTRHGTTENLYEEVSEHRLRNVPSDNSIAISTADYVKEDVRRVQHNHLRVLDELNLSLEALIMPPSPENLSPKELEDSTENIACGGIPLTQTTSTSKAALPQKPRRYGLLGGDSSSLSSSGQPNGLSSSSLENGSTFHSMELKHSPHNLFSNPEFDECDLDSGFSGSGSSSGASYNDSLRNYKSSNPLLLIRNQGFMHTKNTGYPPASPGALTLKSSVASQEEYDNSSVVYTSNGFNEYMSPASFQTTQCNYVRRPDPHQIYIPPIPPGICTGATSKKSFWTMKP